MYKINILCTDYSQISSIYIGLRVYLCREVPTGVYVAGGFSEAVDLVSSPDLASQVADVFVIGGHSVYKVMLFITAKPHGSCA